MAYKEGGILFSREELQARCRELGAQISKDYEGKEIFCIGILKGAALFMSDLLREIRGEVVLDFMVLSSYGSGTDSSGRVEIRHDLDMDVRGRSVLVVEDIVDTGRSMAFLKKYLLEEKGAAEVRIASLLDKPSRRKVDIQVDYVGFTVADQFIVGYGLDLDQKYRNLPDIRFVTEEE
jgi:hypoxanthine phosphoribosyltransferase